MLNGLSEPLCGELCAVVFNFKIKLNLTAPVEMSAPLTKNIPFYKSTSKMNQSTEHESTEHEKSWEELIEELRGSSAFTEMQDALESGKGWGDLAMEDEERQLRERTARLSGQVAELTELEKRLAAMPSEAVMARSSGFAQATKRRERQALLEKRAALTAAVGETAAATARSAAATAVLAAQSAARSATAAAAPQMTLAAVRAELARLPTDRELSRPPWTATARMAIQRQRQELLRQQAALTAPVRAPAPVAKPAAPQSRFALLAEESDSDSGSDSGSGYESDPAFRTR